MRGGVDDVVRVRGISFRNEEADELVGVTGLIGKESDAESKRNDEGDESEEVMDHRLVSPAESFVCLPRTFVKGVVDEGIDKGSGESKVKVDEEGEDGEEV